MGVLPRRARKHAQTWAGAGVGYLSGAVTVGTAWVDVSARDPGRNPTNSVTAKVTASARPAPNGMGSRLGRAGAGAPAASASSSSPMYMLTVIRRYKNAAMTAETMAVRASGHEPACIDASSK